jgi:peptide/nickel transport system substrate-binding protein
MLNIRKKGALLAILFCTTIFMGVFFLFKTNKHHPAHTKKTSSPSLNAQNQTLFIVLDSKIQTGDPRLIGSDANSQYLENLRFLPLITFNRIGELVPCLAENIRPISNKTWEISLKKGIHFFNKQEITAYDVEATYKKIMQSSTNFPPSPRKGAFANVKTFVALSPHLMRLELQQPDVSFLNNLVVGILPKEAAQNALPHDLDRKGYESGPFLLEKKEPTSWILKRNEHYNFAEKPKIKFLNFKMITDSGTRYAALIRGDIDIAQNAIDPDKISVLKNSYSHKFSVVSGPKLSTVYLAFNFRDPVFQNIKVRKALALAIDRKTLLQFRLQGQGLLATGMFPPTHPYFNSSLIQISYDPEQAKKLLQETAFSKAQLSFVLKVSNNNRWTVEIAKAIAANLKDVGFFPSVEMLENNIFLDQVKKGTAKIWISPWVGFKDPDHLRFVFGSQMVPPWGANRGAYHNSALDKLFQQGLQELNFVKRKTLYDKAQLMIAQDLPYVYLWHSLNIAVVSQKVHGFQLYFDGRYGSLATLTKREEN